MDDPDIVQILDGLEERLEDPPGFGFFETLASVLVDVVEEGASIDEFHDQVYRAFGLESLVGPHHVRHDAGGQHLGLPVYCGDFLGGALCLVDDFHRPEALGLHVYALVDAAEAALPDLLLEPVLLEDILGLVFSQCAQPGLLDLFGGEEVHLLRVEPVLVAEQEPEPQLP
jgi:hypothetical protein